MLPTRIRRSETERGERHRLAVPGRDRMTVELARLGSGTKPGSTPSPRPTVLPSRAGQPGSTGICHVLALAWEQEVNSVGLTPALSRPVRIGKEDPHAHIPECPSSSPR